MKISWISRYSYLWFRSQQGWMSTDWKVNQQIISSHLLDAIIDQIFLRLLVGTKVLRKCEITSLDYSILS